MDQQPTPLEWTPERVQRFWDYWATRADGQGTYFAGQVGKGVCKFLESIRSLSGVRVLDYGAGPGYLAELLLQRGAQVAAAEYSADTVAELNQRFRRERNWLSAKQVDGYRLPWGDDEFEMVVCLETIEHLLPEHLNPVLRELKRVLRPGGLLICTTPNSEDLRQQMIYCPCCSHEFHRWQHVRSWTPDNLSRHLAELGYEVPFCAGLNFHQFQPQRWRWSRLCGFRFWKQLVRSGWYRARDWWAPRTFPEGRWFRYQATRSTRQHLAVVAVKPLPSTGSGLAVPAATGTGDSAARNAA